MATNIKVHTFTMYNEEYYQAVNCDKELTVACDVINS